MQQTLKKNRPICWRFIKIALQMGLLWKKSLCRPFPQFFILILQTGWSYRFHTTDQPSFCPLCPAPRPGWLERPRGAGEDPEFQKLQRGPGRCPPPQKANQITRSPRGSENTQVWWAVFCYRVRLKSHYAFNVNKLQETKSLLSLLMGSQQSHLHIDVLLIQNLAVWTS